MPTVVNPGTPPNGDGSWADFSGLYAKALKHDNPGIPNPPVYKAFLSELKRGETTGNRPITPALFEPSNTVPNLLGGTAKLNGPQGAFLIQPVGEQSPDYDTVPAPEVGSDDYAVELIELYWASLLRDIPFTAYGSDTTVAQAVADFNRPEVLPHYRGPVDNTGKVTPNLLFRGGLQAGKRTSGDPAYFGGESFGPYVSQLAIIPTSLGGLGIDQMIQPFHGGHDFMTNLGEWYNVQQGIAPSESLTFDPGRRFMNRGRDFAAYTHIDELYQAYLVAYLVLSTLKAPTNPQLPYSGYPNAGYKVQKAFGTLGGPDATGILGLVARAAINAVWYQKWVVNLRHRPEAGGGLVHLRKSGATPLPQAAAAFSAEFLNLIEPAIEASATRYSNSATKTYLLSQAFPEGSPTHPAYPTGHGVVAGACITALKFFFDGSAKMTDLASKIPTVLTVKQPAPDGLTLTPYTGADAAQMTVNGELHKLAHNVSFGHGIHGGIHWRSDTDESIIFGEQVALSVLRALVKDYSESINVTIQTVADGVTATIAN